MNTMKNIAIRDLQIIEYYALCELDKLCQKLNIKMVLAFGTVLDAIRHKGFIPWDDDIDVMVSAKDYLKLRKYFKKHGNHIDGLFLADYTTDHETLHCLPRIRVDNTHLNEYATDGLNINKGIWIDIFVYCDSANDPKKDKLQEKLIGVVLMLHEKYLNRQKIKQGKPVDSNWIYSLAEKCPEKIRLAIITMLLACIRILGSNKSDRIFCVCAYADIYFLKKEILTDTIEAVFEKKSFLIPRNYDEYMKLFYGDDYMTPRKDHPHFGYDDLEYPDELLKNIKAKLTRDNNCPDENPA